MAPWRPENDVAIRMGILYPHDLSPRMSVILAFIQYVAPLGERVRSRDFLRFRRPYGRLNIRCSLFLLSSRFTY
jgi:hypothetical protein